MNRDTRAKFIVIVILTAIAAFVAAPIPGKPRIPFLSDARMIRGIDLDGGAELRYKVLFPPEFKGDKEHATKQASDVIRRRLETRQLKEPKINTHGDRGIVIQLAGVDADGLREYRRLIETLGNLELYAAAPGELQERYDQSKVVPDGYRVVRNGENAEFLIPAHPVMEGHHIINAEPHPETLPGGVRWATSFELDAEGAKLFDDAAEKLYHQAPRGRIVILLDGAVKSAPVVQSPAFHGRGQISGAKDQKDAADLSIILKSGSLPAPIGSE